MFKVDLKAHRPKRKIDNTYLCSIRKRLITATPEEEVRQSIVSYLINEKGYPIENISIEIPLTHFPNGKGKKGRADIVIFDNDENILCLIECKEPNEFLSDNVLEQIDRYDEIINAENLCIAIGGEFYFYMKNEDGFLLLTEFPSYKTLMENGQIEYFLPDIAPFEKFTFQEPIPKKEIKVFYDEGIIGRDTDKKLLPFLINLYNFYIDKDDTVTGLEGIEDIGIKATKYGNASGGVFFGSYRAFLDFETKSVVSFSISSMTRGDGYPVRTSLMFAVDIKGAFHLSLELNLEKHVSLIGNFAEVTHDGKITIGKIGSAKRSELIDFITEKRPHLIRDGKVYLGKLDCTKEIKANQSATKEFIKNCIEYAIIRDQFRDIRKGSR